MFNLHQYTCDYVEFIKEGYIIDNFDIKQIHSRPFREYEITFFDKDDMDSSDTSQIEVLSKNEKELKLVVKIDLAKTDGMIRELRKHNIKSIVERQYSLEQYFLEHVEGGKENGSRQE